MGRETLQRADEEEELASVLARQRRDGRTGLLQRGGIDDEPLLLQALKRTAHGRAAHAETRGDVGLDDARAGRESSVDNELAQSLVHLLRPRALARFPWNGHHCIGICIQNSLYLRADRTPCKSRRCKRPHPLPSLTVWCSVRWSRRPTTMKPSRCRTISGVLASATGFRRRSCASPRKSGASAPAHSMPGAA